MYRQTEFLQGGFENIISPILLQALFTGRPNIGGNISGSRFYTPLITEKIAVHGMDNCPALFDNPFEGVIHGNTEHLPYDLWYGRLVLGRNYRFHGASESIPYVLAIT